MKSCLQIILGVIFCFFCIAQFDCSGENDKPKVYGDNTADRLEAYIYTEDFVKKRLKSPSSAIFPDAKARDESVLYLGDGKYKIKSYVDSQNSFGAMLRTKFSCEITFADGMVTCNSLVIE